MTGAPLTWEDWAGLDYEPIPLKPGTKQPVADGWAAADIFSQWAAAGADSNIGLRCGGGLRLAVLDADGPAAAAHLAGHLAGLGYAPEDVPTIQTPSGNRHFYAALTVTPTGHTRHWRADIGPGEFRYGPAALVGAPPSVVNGSPYRLLAGDLRQLPRLEPNDVKDLLPIGALEDTTTTTATTPTDRRKLSPLAWALLRGHAPTIARYKSRSEAESALCASLSATGYDFPAVLRLFTTFPCAGKFAELHARSPKHAAGWLSLTFRKAQAFTAAPSGAAKLARYWLAWSAARPWPGRTGAIDADVFQAHCAIAARCGKSEFGASSRELAELAGVSRPTATTATNRLLSVGLLRRAGCATVTWPNRFSLLPAEKCKLYHSITPPVNDWQSSHFFSSADVFRAGGFGKAGADVWELLADGRGLNAAEFSELTGRHRTTIARVLKRMSRIVDPVTGEISRMVEKRAGKWYAVPEADLTHIARLLGTAGKADRQREKHRAERQANRRALKLAST